MSRGSRTPWKDSVFSVRRRTKKWCRRPSQARDKTIGAPAEAAFRGEVFAGKTDYKQATVFLPLYLKPSRCILGLAGWPYNKHDFLSPSIYIYHKKISPSN
ncbi:MAG: hypothetical protein FJ263_01825 [Planctomycetes bacterium]|nr:hypothetical protein [Planctomycetota bacterium]